MKQTKSQIYVVTHKPYSFPKDKLYVPIFVNASNDKKDNYLTDNVGDNIAKKNANYCELTAMYWVWKNSTSEIVGINHYRRYFSNRNIIKRICTRDYNNIILTEQEIKKLLQSYDILVSKKILWLESSVYKNYGVNHRIGDLEACRDIIKNQCPEYEKAFDIALSKRRFAACNMLITRKEIFDDYCKWLFDILFELEKKINIADYDDYQKRVFGFLSERLMNVYIEHNKLRVGEMSMVILEKTPLKTYIRDLWARLIRKGALK